MKQMKGAWDRHVVLNLTNVGLNVEESRVRNGGKGGGYLFKISLGINRYISIIARLVLSANDPEIIGPMDRSHTIDRQKFIFINKYFNKSNAPAYIRNILTKKRLNYEKFLLYMFPTVKPPKWIILDNRNNAEIKEDTIIIKN